MKKAIVATKVGMTQIFNEDGVLTPVTVLEAGPVYVTQIKNEETDGYSAVQVGFGDIREKLVNKPMQGHFSKAGVDNKRFVTEFKLDGAEEYTLGQEIKADIFEAGDKIDVTATSKGKVFKGKKMPGQMGAVKVTIQNLEVVRVDAENNLLLVKGAVPGPKKSTVIIKESVKA